MWGRTSGKRRVRTQTEKTKFTWAVWSGGRGRTEGRGKSAFGSPKVQGAKKRGKELHQTRAASGILAEVLT